MPPRAVRSTAPPLPRSPIKPVTGSNAGGLRSILSKAVGPNTAKRAELAAAKAKMTSGGLGQGIMNMLGKAAQPAMKKGGKVPAKKKKYV